LFPSEKIVFLPSVEKTTIFSSGNKSSPQSFSVPGIKFPPRRNIYSRNAAGTQVGQQFGSPDYFKNPPESNISKMLINHYCILLDLTFVVTLQPRMLILTKATMVIMATMATKIMHAIKYFLPMLQELKLDNNLVHQTTSKILQKVIFLKC
jgi:hypothetical protein